MLPEVRAGVVALLLAASAPVPAADPVVMFLIGLARDMIESHLARRPAPPAVQPASPLPEVYAGTLVQPRELQRLIDESFAYLSGEQRREIFEALHAGLLEPKNAAVRPAMIEYFAHQALAIRAAQARLAGLTPREQDALASGFAKEVAALPAAEQARFAELLRRGLLPLPRELNQRLLASLVAR